MIFLSFGAGVQSSVMLMMAIRGEIERPDHVIFADTGFEPRAVYAHAKWAEKQCKKNELPFHVTQAPLNMRQQFEAFERGEIKFWNMRPPLFSEGGGQTRRQCTRDAKITPLKRLELRLAGQNHKNMR